MKKNLLTLLVFCIITCSGAYAQTRKVSGKVTGSDDGQPVAAVSVKIAGTNGGTQTNADGRFSLTAPETGSLIFSSIGYRTITVKINGQTELNVKLISDNRALSEIVVTGYGQTITKREVGGAISTIGSKEFQNQPIASLQTALQGRAAGVVIQANNGIPGGAINVRIRGVGSFTGSTQPLYVVDGIQLSF